MTLLLVLVICLHGYLLCAKGTRLAPYTYVFPMSTPVTLLTPLVTPVDNLWITLVNLWITLGGGGR